MSKSVINQKVKLNYDFPLDNEVFEIIGERENQYEIKGDFSAGTNNVCQSQWIDKSEVKEWISESGMKTEIKLADEKLYTKTINEVSTTLSFGNAFDLLKNGKIQYMRLPNWQEDVKIKCQFPDKNSKMTAPYLYVESRFGLVPWKETNIELFSDKWMVY